MGAIKTLNLNRRNATPQAITSEKGIYREPVLSADGQTLLFRKESGNNHQGHAYTVDTGLFTIPVSGGEPTKISDRGSAARFNAEGDRIFYQARTSYRSMDLNGQDDRQHFRSEYALNYSPSPDNKWIAFTELFKVYIAPRLGRASCRERVGVATGVGLAERRGVIVR